MTLICIYLRMPLLLFGINYTVLFAFHRPNDVWFIKVFFSPLKLLKLVIFIFYEGSKANKKRVG